MKVREEIKEKLDSSASNFEGGGVQVGGLERSGMHQPSPLGEKTKIVRLFRVLRAAVSYMFFHTPRLRVDVSTSINWLKTATPATCDTAAVAAAVAVRFLPQEFSLSRMRRRHGHWL